MFIKTAVPQICSNFTGKHQCRSMILIKLVNNLTVTTFPHVCSCWKSAQHIFCRTPIGDWLWICNVIKLVKMILKSLWYFAYLIYPFLLNLFFWNWSNYLIFKYEISKCWNELKFTIMKKKKKKWIYWKTLQTPAVTFGSLFLNIR